MKRIRIFLTLILLTTFAGHLAAQSPAQVTLVKAGRLLDPKTGNVLAPAAVLQRNPAHFRAVIMGFRVARMLR